MMTCETLSFTGPFPSLSTLWYAAASPVIKSGGDKARWGSISLLRRGVNNSHGKGQRKLATCV